MKTLVVSILFGILFLASAAPVVAQQPIGTPPAAAGPGAPLGPQSIGQVPPSPDYGPILASEPLPPPPVPPAGDLTVRHAIVLSPTFLYGFNLWTDHWQFGCNRAPSMLMMTRPGERITVQLNPGRGLDANTWVRVLDGWYKDCYVETWALSID